MTTSITVLEQKSGPQFIFGLDMLRRHQCSIDLAKGKEELVIWDSNPTPNKELYAQYKLLFAPFECFAATSAASTASQRVRRWHGAQTHLAPRAFVYSVWMCDSKIFTDAEGMRWRRYCWMWP